MKEVSVYELRLHTKDAIFTPIDHVGGPEDAIEIIDGFVGSLKSLPEEHVWVIGLDIRNHPIGIFEVSHGTTTCVPITPRDILKRLLLINAVGFVCIHNHPSGDAKPSKEDYESKDRLSKSGDVIGIQLFDFIMAASRDDWRSI